MKTTSEIKLTIRTFEMGTDKEAALKPLEEAAEVYSAWQELDKCGSPEKCPNCEVNDICDGSRPLADEIADTIQASCNLAARYGIDLQAAMERCKQRNRERGRYPMEEEKHVESCGDCGGHDCDCGGSCGDVPAGTGDLRQKSPEEMSVAELIEVLKATCGSNFECQKILGVDLCKDLGNCSTCREHILDLLETAYKQEKEGLRCEESYLSDEIVKRDKEIEGLKREIADLTHERDGLRRRLEELSEAGITELHKFLRETIGNAKNIADTARIYVEKARERRKPDSEREAVIERLRKIDFAQERVTLYKIAVAILGYEPASSPWWGNESHAKLRDKLIELLNTPGRDYCETCEAAKNAEFHERQLKTEIANLHEMLRYALKHLRAAERESGRDVMLCHAPHLAELMVRHGVSVTPDDTELSDGE